MVPRRIALLFAAVLPLAACKRASRADALADSTGAIVDSGVMIDSAAIRATRLWRGVFNREGVQVSFRPCGRTRAFFVEGRQSLLDRMVARTEMMGGLEWYMVLRGDTMAARPGDTASVRGTMHLLLVDSVRVHTGQCPWDLSDAPPVRVASLEAALRAALGPDAGLVRPANYRATGAWLDRDRRGDALVIVKGGKLCNVNGCTLFLLHGMPNGSYEVIGRTIGVELPLGVLARMTGGYHDVFVGVNQGRFGHRTRVWLVRHAGGYPRDAATQPDVRLGAEGLMLLEH